MSDDDLERYEDDELILARIGAQLFRQETTVKVRVSSELAAEAVRAWARDENDPRTEERFPQWKRDRLQPLA